MKQGHIYGQRHQAARASPLLCLSPRGTLPYLSSKGMATEARCWIEQASAPVVDKQPWPVTLIKEAVQILLQLLKRAGNSPPCQRGGQGRPPTHLPPLWFLLRGVACLAKKVLLSSLKIHEKAEGFLKGKQLIQPRQVSAKPWCSVNRW